MTDNIIKHTCKCGESRTECFSNPAKAKTELEAHNYKFYLIEIFILNKILTLLKNGLLNEFMHSTFITFELIFLSTRFNHLGFHLFTTRTHYKNIYIFHS